jgi:hypothetical protein
MLKLEGDFFGCALNISLLEYYYEWQRKKEPVFTSFFNSKLLNIQNYFSLQVGLFAALNSSSILFIVNARLDPGPLT